MNITRNSHPVGENLKPSLQPHVLWYRHNKKDFTFVINQYLDHPQITRLVTDFDVALFEKCNGLLTADAIARSLSVPVERSCNHSIPGSTWLLACFDGSRH